MADLLAVCEDLKAAAATVPRLHAHAVVADQVVLPAVVFSPASPFAQYRTRMGRSTVAEWQLLATVVVGRMNEAAAHTLLYGFLSPGSPLIDAINAVGPATGAVVVQTATVTAGLRYGRFSFGEADYLGAQLAIEVVA